MGITGVDSEDIELGERGWDGYTDGLGCDGAVKFACYPLPPAGIGAHVGFAPAETP
jgi:hypothetical protein